MTKPLQTQQGQDTSAATDVNPVGATQTLPGTETTPDVAKGVETRSNNADEPNATTDVAPTSPKEKRQNEAAKWRTRLRETEAQLAEYATKIEALERQLVEHYSGLPKPAALWAGGITLNDLKDEQGIISRDKVVEADARVKEELGIVGHGLPKPDPAQGRGGSTKPANSFAGAFRL